MYSIRAYGAMIADRVRTDAYEQALRQAVRPGAVVLDIGTGTGIFALMACRFGARHVYAIEPNPAIEVARMCAAANGYADRITYIEGLSTAVDLPEKADVIVSDVRGTLPLNGGLSAVIDARDRLLAQGGVLIPQRDNLWLAVVEAKELYRSVSGPWEDHPYSVDLRPARPLVINTRSFGTVKPDQLLAEPQLWATLDYCTIQQISVTGKATSRIARNGTGHGLSLWFDSHLLDGIGYSTGPTAEAPATIYGNVFLPWIRPVELAENDQVSVTVRADLVGDEYVWSWTTRVVAADGPGETKAAFDQSTFFGVPLSAKRRRTLAADNKPVRNDEAEIDAFILVQMDGRSSSGDIAERVLGRFPGRFRDWATALTRVGWLSERYSR